MCHVSDKLKFCSCSAASVDKLKHYWVFHRFVKGKNDLVMGEPLLPEVFELVADRKQNETTLLKRLNEADAFDIDLQPHEKDRLEINFSFPQIRERHYTYGFKFHKGKWVKYDYDLFDWMRRHQEESFGKIKNAIIKNAHH